MASQFWFIRLFHYVSINLFDYPILDNQNSLKAIIVTLLILIITVFLSNIIKSFYPKNHLVKMIGNAFGIR